MKGLIFALKPSAGKKYRKAHPVLSGLLINNPALVLGFDLPFLIAASTGVRNAVAMSIEMFFVHMATMLVVVLFTRKMPPWQRVIVTVAVSTATMMLTRELLVFLFPDILNSLGMYIYLLSVNGLTFYESLSMNKRAKVRPVMRREFFHVFAFIAVMFPISLAREYFGSGAVWGISVSMPFKLGGVIMPFFGFILMGFLLAAVKFINKKLIGFVVNDAQRREERYIIIR